MFLSTQKPMSLSEMWHTFCEAKQEFIPNYIAYHYFRSKGWVPKLGIKYGTDLGKLLDLVVCLSYTNKIELCCITTQHCLIAVIFITRQYGPGYIFIVISIFPLRPLPPPSFIF